MKTGINISLIKSSGGFSGATKFSLSIMADLTSSGYDQIGLLKEAKENAVEFLKARFPELEIDVDNMCIEEHHFL